MSFGENLQFLRKRNNITQEQFAEKLEVSRQSVSKWEAGGSYPEMDKLLIMCDMFSCDLDTLLRGNAEESVAEDTAQYDAHMNDRSRWFAAAVGLILLGLGFAALLEGLGSYEAAEAFAFMTCVAAAVVIFIVKGLQHESFQKRYPHINQFYTEEGIYRFEKKFPVFVAAPVALIILDVACIPILEGLFERMGYSDDLSGAVFLLLLAIAIPILVYGGMQKEKYNIKEYNRESMHSPDKEKIGKWCGVIMLAATALFILSIGVESIGYMQAKSAGIDYSWKSSIMSFSWVVFPIGGILCGIVSLILTKTGEKETDTADNMKTIQDTQEK